MKTAETANVFSRGSQQNGPLTNECLFCSSVMNAYLRNQLQPLNSSTGPAAWAFPIKKPDSDKPELRHFYADSIGIEHFPIDSIESCLAFVITKSGALLRGLHNVPSLQW